MNSKKLLLILPLSFLIISISFTQAKKNVLLILADDFNHWANCIGYYPQSLTPNVDKLAKKGVLFTNAHCASPVCNPSRNAFMSGIRPSTSGITSNPSDAQYGGYIRDKVGFENVVTMNQFFTDSGYYSCGGGKIYHTGRMTGDEVDAENWDSLYTSATGSNGGSFYKWESQQDDLFKWSAGEFNINNSNDTKLAKHFANKLSTYNGDEPFFFVAGLFRPHLPWNCHKQFWDLFNTDTLDIPAGYKANDLDDEPVLPNARAIHTEIVDSGLWKEGIRAYLANLAYADYNIGIMIDALEASDHANNTIVIFYGDHGWHLGEKDRWSKHAVFGLASQTTFIVYNPDAAGNGQICPKVVSLQDVYPTLLELCDFGLYKKIEGNSLKPLLDNPLSSSWNVPIIVSYRGSNIVRTNEYSYVKHSSSASLYHTASDPYEWTNLIYNAGHSYGVVVTQMEHILDSFITAGEILKETYYNEPSTTSPFSYLQNKATSQYLAYNSSLTLVDNAAAAGEWELATNGTSVYIELNGNENQRLKAVDNTGTFALTTDFGAKVSWKIAEMQDGYFSLENSSFTGYYLAATAGELSLAASITDASLWKKVETGSSDFGQIKNTSEIILSPNPTNDKLYFSFENFNRMATIHIYNLDGKLISSSKRHVTDDDNFIDMSEFCNGNYIVQIEHNGMKHTSKILKY